MRSAPGFQQSTCPSSPTRKMAYSFASVASRSKRSPISCDESRLESSEVMAAPFCVKIPPSLTTRAIRDTDGADWLGGRHCASADGQIRKEGHPASFEPLTLQD